MWCSERRRLLASVAALAALPACGFEPLYAPSGPAAAALGKVEVEVIEGTPGFLMRERLIDLLGPAEAPTHRLAVDLALDKVGVAITEQDVTTRFNIRGTAAWRLFPIGAAEPVLSGEAGAVSGYGAPSSDTASAFAILSAQRAAEETVALLLADRIARRLALDAGVWAP
jgi:LPS-assembly lipoprotein